MELRPETAMAYYQLERSADGHAFTTIYRADATVNNGNTAQYSYPDNDALPGTCYYRIRAIGQDGQQQFSPIVKLTGKNHWQDYKYIRIRLHRAFADTI